MPVMEEIYLTAEDVAKKLRKSYDSVLRLFRQREMPGSFKVGGEWRISQSDLEKYIEAQKQK